jgi:hypothetical protein
MEIIDNGLRQPPISLRLQLQEQRLITDRTCCPWKSDQYYTLGATQSLFRRILLIAQEQ